MYCRAENHDFEDSEAMRRELTVVHIRHLIAQDPTLNEVCELPKDMGAERDGIGAKWKYFYDADDE